ncbi:hypothetical protein ACPA3B_21600 [Bacillus bombysepticus]|nr:hypothetical protein [Bacillus cereus]
MLYVIAFIVISVLAIRLNMKYYKLKEEQHFLIQRNDVLLHKLLTVK